MSYNKTAKYEAFFEKKATIGYSTKWFCLQGLKLVFADSESGAIRGEWEILSVTRTAESGGETYGINLTATGTNEVIQIKAQDRTQFFQWYNLFYTALEHADKLPPRNCGLPAEDPRTGLPFVEVPPEYLRTFVYLDNAVIHWFNPIKKQGVSKGFSVFGAIEERVGVIGDKFVYVCKPTGDITRCMKILEIEKIWTNSSTCESDNAIAALKMRSPDYDLFFSCGIKECQRFVETVRILFRYITKGRDVPCVELKEADILKECNLTRPNGWDFTLTLPTAKVQLKKAFDVFAQRTGVKLLAGAKPTESPASPTPVSGVVLQTAPASGNVVQGNAPGENPSFVPRTDPMGYFLIKLGLEQYFAPLTKQKVDLDVLEFMEAGDLQHFGVTDPSHRARILEAFTKESFMDEVREEVAQLRARAKKGKKEEQEAPLMPAKVTAESASTKKMGVVLDDDDLVPPKPKVCLDDDDDLPPPKPKPKVSLDDDDDLPPPKPKPKVSLDDDL